MGRRGWLLLFVLAILLALIFWGALVELERLWSTREEYSHAYLIPVISAFLLWQNKNEFMREEFSGSWSGLIVCVIGLAVFVMGDLGTLYVLQHYSLIVVLGGLALSLTGWRGVRLWWAPLLLLLFMVPLPPFLHNNLSGKLQLISSDLGVAVIRVCRISVFREGNVIDLGNYKLQVVEACDGLRYLFPLMSFGFLAAYFFVAPVWQRLVVFLSTIPVTVLMNSFRIGVIGVLVEYWGIQQAEGFLHYFEGWIIFMACVGILVAEMWALTRLTRPGVAFREVFGIYLPTSTAPTGAPAPRQKLPRAFLASFPLLLGVAIASQVMGERAEAIPARKDSADFPNQLGDWAGRRDSLDEVYLKALELTDYAIIDFRRPEGEWVNFYVAYYASQRSGKAAHSPRACIPGGGWEIRGLSERRLDGLSAAGEPLEVNRVQIQKGDSRQLVYYWFQQRGRVITSEYLVKWYLFWDSLTRNRSDGALVRLTTNLKPGEDWNRGDERLQDFARELSGQLDAYIPK